MPASRRLLRAVLLGAVAAGLIAPSTAAKAEPPATDLEQQLEKAGNALEDIIEQYNLVTEQLKASQAAAAEIAAQLPGLQANVDAANATVSQMAVTAYKGGQVGTLTALLSSGSTASLVDTLATLDHLARQQRTEMAGYADLKLQRDTEKQRLDTLLAQQAAQQRDLTANRVRIEADMQKLQDMKRRADEEAARRRPPPAPGARSTAARPPVPYAPGRAGIAVKFAYAQLGKPYRWGAEGPGSYDCSGLTLMAWRAAGVSLPHNAAMQWKRVAHITRAALQLGDLVFYRGLGHVSIYVGNDQVITAPTTGQVVKLAPINTMPPYGYGRPG